MILYLVAGLPVIRWHQGQWLGRTCIKVVLHEWHRCVFWHLGTCVFLASWPVRTLDWYLRLVPAAQSKGMQALTLALHKRAQAHAALRVFVPLLRLVNALILSHPRSCCCCFWGHRSRLGCLQIRFCLCSLCMCPDSVRRMQCATALCSSPHPAAQAAGPPSCVKAVVIALRSESWLDVVLDFARPTFLLMLAYSWLYRR